MILPITELKIALAGLGKVITRHETLPVLSMIRLKRFSDGIVELTATDLDAHVTVRLKVHSPGEANSFLLPYQELLKVVRTCGKHDSLHLEPLSELQHRVKVQSPGNPDTKEHEWDTPHVDEFPEVPEVSKDVIPLPEKFSTNLQQALQCASTEETRYVLRSACVDMTDRKCHHIVASDGRQLFSSNSFTLPFKKSLIIRTHRFLQWKEFAEDGAWQLRVTRNERGKQSRLVLLQSDHWRFVANTIGDRYPNWKQVIPDAEDFKTEVEIDPEMIRHVIETVEKMPDADPENHKIRIEIKRCNVRFVAQPSKGGGSTSLEVPTRLVSGQDQSVYVNRQFLVRALRFGLHHLQIIDSLSPLRCHNEAGKQMIIMPVRHDQAAHRPQNTNPVPDSPVAATPPAPESPQEPETPPSASVTTEVETQPKPHNAMANPFPDKPGLHMALDQIEVIKGNLRSVLGGLNQLDNQLRLAVRENKTTEKEIRTARQTLRSLQAVTI